MENVFINQDYMSNPTRKSFYSKNKSLCELNHDVSEICLENKTEIPSLIIDKIKMCLSVDSDYEVWTPFSIIKRSSENRRVISFSQSVSSKGRIYSHYRDRILPPRLDDSCGYYKAYMGGGSFLIQRVVLSSFGYDIIHPSGLSLNALTANHKDHIRSNNELANLEWMTSLENITDMQNHIGSDHSKFPKPIKIVLNKDIGSLEKGSVFFLENRKTLISYGLNPGSIRNAITKGFHLRGCFLYDIPVDLSNNLIFGIPDELIKYFNRNISN